MAPNAIGRYEAEEYKQGSSLTLKSVSCFPRAVREFFRSCATSEIQLGFDRLRKSTLEEFSQRYENKKL